MTLSALGIFSAAGAGGGAALSDYELIETQILGSSQASITFSSLGTYSSTYKHLQIRYTAKNNSNDFSDNFFVTVNGDTSANYSHHRLVGNGSAVTSIASTSQNSMILGRYGQSVGTIFGAGVIDILDPYSTTKNKTFRSFYGCFNTTFVMLNSGLWMATSSVTSLSLSASPVSFAAGSRFSLYGIKG